MTYLFILIRYLKSEYIIGKVLVKDVHKEAFKLFDKSAHHHFKAYQNSYYSHNAKIKII